MGPIILLILLGLILLLVETLLLPGFFFTGILGVLSLAAACYFGFVNFGNTGCIVTVIISVAVAAAFMVWILRSKTWKKATLNTEIKASVDQRPLDKGISAGLKGSTTTKKSFPQRIACLLHGRMRFPQIRKCCNYGLSAFAIRLKGEGLRRLCFLWGC